MTHLEQQELAGSNDGNCNDNADFSWSFRGRIPDKIKRYAKKSAENTGLDTHCPMNRDNQRMVF